MIWRRVLSYMLLALPLLAGGCAITPRPALTHLCDFQSYDLAVEQPPNFRDETRARQTLGDVLNRTIFAAGPRTDATVPSQSMLFLSGGSLHGAFGAGFLADWKKRSPDQHLPDFKVVTGISTGAILSTFAFVNAPERAVDGYTIESEADLLKPFAAVKNGAPTTSGYVQLLKKGALADLSPLRDRLFRFIDDDMLQKVHAEGQRGRLLLIGVVDVDTGQAVVLDLTDMARQYVEATEAGVRDSKHACFIEGIIASSSAPLAALPVFLDNRMYVDGGVRFGMFTDEIGAQIEKNRDSSAKPTIYLLINGDQELQPQCGKADPANCKGGLDPAGNIKGEHAKWSFPALALRSEGMLANQVYRFSAFAVAESAKRRGMAFRMVKIKDDLSGYKFPRDAQDQPLPDAKSCTDWRAVDRSEGDPLQFYPHYMRCVIAYGRTRAATDLLLWKQDDLNGGGPF